MTAQEPWPPVGSETYDASEGAFAYLHRHAAADRYTPRFDIGDTIFVVRGNQKQRQSTTCHVCDGTGRVQVPGASSRSLCPECTGAGRLLLDSVVRYYTLHEVTVGQVEVTVTTEHPFRPQEAERVGEGQWRKVRYMAHETGVGSGSCYPEPSCFPDEASARAFAESQDWVTEDEAKAPGGGGGG